MTKHVPRRALIEEPTGDRAWVVRPDDDAALGDHGGVAEAEVHVHGPGGVGHRAGQRLGTVAAEVVGDEGEQPVPPGGVGHRPSSCWCRVFAQPGSAHYSLSH